MRAILPFAALLLAAAPTAAQTMIQPGQTVVGELAAADPVLQDGSRYDLWRFPAKANHAYRVTLRSSEFDAFLVVGTTVRPGCDACSTDDDGAGGSDAQVEYTGAEDGTYEIRAFSHDADASGRYELTLVDEGVHEHGEAASGAPIALGDLVIGRLERGDEKADVGYTDTYTYQGRAGETIAVTLTAIDFVGYLQVGAFDDGECEGMDMAYDRDHRGVPLTLTLPRDGAYHFHVGAERQGRVANYTLRLERGDPANVEAAP